VIVCLCVFPLRVLCVPQYDDMQYDELLVQQRTHLIVEAAKLLMRCRMVKVSAAAHNHVVVLHYRMCDHQCIEHTSDESC